MGVGSGYRGPDACGRRPGHPPVLLVPAVPKVVINSVIHCLLLIPEEDETFSIPFPAAFCACMCAISALSMTAFRHARVPLRRSCACFLAVSVESSLAACSSSSWVSSMARWSSYRVVRRIFVPLLVPRDLCDRFARHSCDLRTYFSDLQLSESTRRRLPRAHWQNRNERPPRPVRSLSTTSEQCLAPARWTPLI